MSTVWVSDLAHVPYYTLSLQASNQNLVNFKQLKLLRAQKEHAATKMIIFDSTSIWSLTIIDWPI